MIEKNPTPPEPLREVRVSVHVPLPSIGKIIRPLRSALEKIVHSSALEKIFRTSGESEGSGQRLKRLRRSLTAHHYLWIALLFVILAFIPFRNIILQPGTIGLRNDWSISPLHEQYGQRIFNTLSTWSPNYLGIYIPRQSMALFSILVGAFATVTGAGGPFMSRLIPIAAMALAGISAYVLLKALSRDSMAAAIGSLLYTFSPLVFNAMGQGIHHFLVSYSFLPLLILTFYSALTSRPRRVWILLAALLYAVTMMQDNFIVINGVVLFLLYVASLMVRSSHAGREVVTKTGVFVSVILLAVFMQAQTFLPFVLSLRASQESLNSTVQFAWNTRITPPLVNALSLDGGGYPYFTRAVPGSLKVVWSGAVIGVWLLAFAAFLLPQARRRVIFFGFLALITLFLFKGSSEPFSAINDWLYVYAGFFMNSIRNIQYITAVTVISLAVLLTTTIAHIRLFISHHIQSAAMRRVAKAASALLPLLIILVYGSPFWSGAFNGEVQTFALHPDYETLYQEYADDPADTRLLWLPPMQPLSYNGSRHAGVDPLVDVSPKASIGNHPVQPLEYLITMLAYTSGVTDTGPLFHVANIRDVIFRSDFVSMTPAFMWGEFTLLPWSNGRLQTFLKNQMNLRPPTRHLANEAISVYQSLKPSAHLYAATAVQLTTGELSDFVELASYWRHTKQSDPTLLFAQQQKLLTDRPLLTSLIDQVIIRNNNLEDLLLLFTPSTVELSVSVLNRDAKDGWAPLSGWWWKHVHLASVLEPGAVYTSTAVDTAINLNIPDNQTRQLWLKTYQSARGSTLKLAIDDTNVATVETATAGIEGFFWHKVTLPPLSPGDHTLKITSKEGENVIARMVVVSQIEITSALAHVEQLSRQKKTVLSVSLEPVSETDFASIFPRPLLKSEEQDEIQLPLQVPSTGQYHIAAKLSTAKNSNAQLVSDFLDTIYSKHSVGQTVTLQPYVTEFTDIAFQIEARDLKKGIPAVDIPDAPLKAVLFRRDGRKREQVAETAVPAEAAPLNDQWEMIKMSFNLAVSITKPTVYEIELSSDAKHIGWAIGNVQNGFNGVPDNYHGGTSMVNGKPQSSDMLFRLTLEGQGKNDLTFQLDDRQLTVPLGSLAKDRWYNGDTITLSAGVHTLRLPRRTGFASIDQLVLERAPDESLSAPAPPEIAFRRKSPTQYRTATIAAASPYLLTFAESYDQKWQAYVQSAQRMALDPRDHLVVNGYANGWLVAASEPHTIQLYYTPQRYFILGLAVAIITIVTLVLILLWPYRRSPVSMLTRATPLWKYAPAFIALGALLVTGWALIMERPQLATQAAIATFMLFVLTLVVRVFESGRIVVVVLGLFFILGFGRAGLLLYRYWQQGQALQQLETSTATMDNEEPVLENSDSEEKSRDTPADAAAGSDAVLDETAEPTAVPAPKPAVPSANPPTTP